MRVHGWLTTTFALLALLAPLAVPRSSVSPTQAQGVKALDGEWHFVEDRTDGRAPEQLGPPMSSRFTLRVEDGAVVLNGHGSGHKDVRVALDGSVTEIVEKERKARYRGAWKDDEFGYEVEFVRGPDNQRDGSIRSILREFRPTSDGLIVRVTVNPPEGGTAVALYRHLEDIAMPTPAKATIGDVAWLAGAWVGKRGEGGTTSFEERWSPPLGGSMLATARTVRGGTLRAFEYLRIVERDGGLVYVAQPNGSKATEFVLAELGEKRAVFLNPRHDHPRRIVYEITPEGGLLATTGQLVGGTPQRYEFRREGG